MAHFESKAGRQFGGGSSTPPIEVPRPRVADDDEAATGHGHALFSSSLGPGPAGLQIAPGGGRHVSMTVSSHIHPGSGAGAGTSAPSQRRGLSAVSSSVDMVGLGGRDKGLDAGKGPTGCRRSHSVMGLSHLSALGEGGDNSEAFTPDLDGPSRSRLAENVWWRSWSIQQRRHHSKLSSIPMSPFMPGEEGLADSLSISISADALSVEGMQKDPSSKRWEDYYQLFLERFATDSNALPFLSQELSSPAWLERRRESSSGDLSGTAFGAKAFGGVEPMEESVHGGNLFAAMFGAKSDAGQDGLATASSHDDFSNYQFPWEKAPTQDGGGAQTVAAPCKLDRSRSHPLMLPRPVLKSVPSGEEYEDPVPLQRPPLDPSLPTGAKKLETILKKAFTGFHNSHKFGQDNVSPYLGDDLSVRGNGFFMGVGGAPGLAQPQPAYRSRSSPTSAGLRPDYGRAVEMEGLRLPGPQYREAVLQRVEDCSMWKRTEQYWLLPAVLAACSSDDVDPAQVSSPLAHALSAYGNPQSANPVDTSLAVDPELEALGLPPLAYDPFSTYVLGEALLSSANLAGQADLRQLPQRWELRLLVVKQNYILEYLPGEPATPIGYTHIQGASISPRLDNHSILHIVCKVSDPAGGRSTSPTYRAFHGSASTGPSASPSPSPSPLAPPGISISCPPTQATVLVRAHSPAQAKRWGWLLERAAKLRTDDLFEYVPLKGLDESLHGTALVKASELGRGRFAVVRRARRRRYPKEREGGRGEEGHRGTVCALKVVNKAAFWQRVAEGKERHDTLVREVLAQALLTAQCFQAGMSGQTCPIVRLFSAFETCDSVVLELELMSRNDLFDELSTSGVLKEHKTAGIVNQIVKAVAFCYEHGIAHRDVKLSNIIFPPDPVAEGGQLHQGPGPRVKLADFGMAGFFAKSGTLRGRCGTPGYVAPEILCAGVNEGYGNNVDIFSVGVVAYTLLCGYEPFYGVTDKQLISANKLAEYEFHDPEWTRISAEAKDLVSRMLVRVPADRITPAEALQHPWLRRFNYEAGDSAAGLQASAAPASGGPLAGAADLSGRAGCCAPEPTQMPCVVM